MNAVFKIFLSMSFSGGLLILALLLGKRYLKDRISRQWQYYIWLVVVLRLLLPFGPETNLLGKTYQAVDQAITRTTPMPAQQPMQSTPGDVPAPVVDLELNSENVNRPAEALTTVHPLQEIGALLTDSGWLIWLAAALGLLIRKVTIYQDFIRYIKAGLTPVSDIPVLDRLSVAQERTGVKKPVELCVNPLVSSPLLIGFFHPCIVLPGTKYSEKDFSYIVLHELTHYKRRDMLYKWLVQITVCLHWFNPLVYLMSREITKACEFSCDEAVLAKMGSDSARDYGKTLLDAMAAVGKYRENLGALTLSENKQLLKERLGAIMKFKKASKAVRIATAALTLCVVFGAAFLGIYSVAAADGQNSADTENPLPSQSENVPSMETLNVAGTTYYLVHNEAQLRAIGTGEYGMDQNYMQQSDIRLSTEEWVPIGTWDNPFTGTFNGNGFEITGLTMTDPDAEIVGLFGIAVDAHIYNVTMRDYDTTNAGRNARRKSVGAIVAVNLGSGFYDNFTHPGEAEEDVHNQADGESLSEIARYYESDNLPLFQIAFSRLDEESQDKWLDKIYADDQIMFWGAAAGLLDEDCDLIQRYAEKIYGDDNITYFSVLATHMSEDILEEWLDRALEDGKWNFQSMLFNLLERDDELDELEEKREKEWEEAQMAEYEAAGITIEGKEYYYHGQLVNVFLDIRANKSFYTLNMNPKGTVNIKVIRDGNNKITGVAYMSDAEVAELFENDEEKEEEEEDADDWPEITGGRIWHPLVIPVNLESVADGEIIWLGEYTLTEGDRIWYAVHAETGNGMQVGFAEPEDEFLDTVYFSVENQRQKDETLECVASMTLRSPVKSGTYKLFLQATDGPLENVRGSVSIGFAADAHYGVQ